MLFCIKAILIPCVNVLNEHLRNSIRLFWIILFSGCRKRHPLRYRIIFFGAYRHKIISVFTIIVIFKYCRLSFRQILFYSSTSPKKNFEIASSSAKSSVMYWYSLPFSVIIFFSGSTLKIINLVSSCVSSCISSAG